jgi:hypothetical protein
LGCKTCQAISGLDTLVAGKVALVAGKVALVVTLSKLAVDQGTTASQCRGYSILYFIVWGCRNRSGMTSLFYVAFHISHIIYFSTLHFLPQRTA